MKTFKPNATKVAQEQLNYFIKTDLGNYAKLRNYDYGPTNRDNVSNLSKYISHRVIDEYYVINDDISLMDEVDEEENQEQTTLMDEVDEEENQEQIKLELSKTFENIEEAKCKSNRLETSSSSGIFSKDQNINNIKELTDNQKLPLPNIKNLRKWINNDKKAS